MLLELIKRSPDKGSIQKLENLYHELLIMIGLGNDNLETRRQIDNRLLSESSAIESYYKRNFVNIGKVIDTEKLKENLSRALRLLSAIPAADKEGGDGGALGIRDDSTFDSLTVAQRLERRMKDIVFEIGEIVAFSDKAGSRFRSDEVFEYFCEKNILSLFIDIAKAKPLTSKLHGSTWSPVVKAEVLHTVSVLITNAQDIPSLYYLLSNNCVNSLVTGMLPLDQWTDPAIKVMLPTYVGLLKSLIHHLVANPKEIFTFLKFDHEFPLFSSTVEIAINPKSDHKLRAKCLDLIITMLQTGSHSVTTFIGHLKADLHQLCEFVCYRTIRCYNLMTKLLIGPVVDHVRCNAVAKQLYEIQNQVEYMNQLLQSGVKTLNVQFCELFLQSVVAVLLRNLITNQDRKLLAVGITDVDVIPEVEALAQLSLVFLAHFWSISYRPLTRMLAVALFHETSTTIWNDLKNDAKKEEYRITRELNDIVESKKVDHIPNPYRQTLMMILTGKIGEWSFIPASMLLEGALDNEAVGSKMITSFGLLPNLDKYSGDNYPESPLEEALVAFFSRKKKIRKMDVSSMAFKRSNAIALRIHHALWSNNSSKVLFIRSSPLMKSLAIMHNHFAQNALIARQKNGVSDVFIDLAQLAIQNRYPKLYSRDRNNRKERGCVLENFGYRSLLLNSEILVRKFRTVESNDVEDCRFAIEMTLQYRVTCQIMSAITSSSPITLPRVEWADDILLTIGDLKKKPPRGADLDLRGQMVFNFHTTSVNPLECPSKINTNIVNALKATSKELVLLSTSQLALVLDQRNLFIVKPVSRREVNRGTIICIVSLRSIIAYASDNEWLHIAIRNMEDVGSIIKNGNMALRFDTVGACLIVKEYIEKLKCRLRNELDDHIQALFQENYLMEDVPSNSDAKEGDFLVSSNNPDNNKINRGGDDQEKKRDMSVQV